MINFQHIWTELTLDEKIEFRDMTIAAVQEIYPHYIVRPLEPDNGDGFFVGNKQDDVRITVPLRDLYIRFSSTGKTHEDLKETIFVEYAGMLNLADDAAIFDEMPDFKWIDAREFVRPQHVRNSELLGEFIAFPFGADVSTALVISPPHDQLAHFISQKTLDSWDMEVNDVFKVAMDNLANISDGLEIVGMKTPYDELWNNSGAEWSSTCLLLPHMRHLIAETFGRSPYCFGIPSRHRFYAWTDLSDEQRQLEMKAKLEREMGSLPKALTSTIYEVNAQGQISIVKPQPGEPPAP